MAFHGHARVSASRPEAFGVCDRCGFLHNLNRLKYQFEWAGPRLINTQARVCPTCMDVPCPQKRTILIPADPIPVRDPRPEAYAVEETDFRTTELGDFRVTEGGDFRVIMESGDEMLSFLDG